MLGIIVEIMDLSRFICVENFIVMMQYEIGGPTQSETSNAWPVMAQRYSANQQDWQQRHAEGIGLKKRMRL